MLITHLRKESGFAKQRSFRQWRERRDLALADRDKISASKKEETIKAARQNLDDFYENYGQKTEKGIAKTRKEAEEFLASREDTAAGGTSWERIAKLVDLSGKGRKAERVEPEKRVQGDAVGLRKMRRRLVLRGIEDDCVESLSIWYSIWRHALVQAKALAEGGSEVDLYIRGGALLSFGTEPVIMAHQMLFRNTQ